MEMKEKPEILTFFSLFSPFFQPCLSPCLVWMNREDPGKMLIYHPSRHPSTGPSQYKPGKTCSGKIIAGGEGSFICFLYSRARSVSRDDFQPGIRGAAISPVCRDVFQPGFSTNYHSTNDLDQFFPAICWLKFCTYAAGWVSLPLHPFKKEQH